MKRIALLALPAALLGTSAIAAEPATSGVRDNGLSYDYFQFGYESRDYDGRFSPELDGLDAQLAHALDEHLFLRGEAQIFEVDPGDGDGWLIAGGLGFHTPLQKSLDLVLSGDLVHVDYDFGDDTGYRLRGGVRHATAPQLELAGGAFLQDIGDFVDSEFGLYGSALFHINEDIDVGAELQLGDDSDVIGLFGRINF